MRFGLRQKTLAVLVVMAMVPLTAAVFAAMGTFERWGESEHLFKLEEQLTLFEALLSEREEYLLEDLTRFAERIEVVKALKSADRNRLFILATSAAESAEWEAFYLVSDDKSLLIDPIGMTRREVDPRYDFHLALALSHQRSVGLEYDPALGVGIVASTPIYDLLGDLIGAVAVFDPVGKEWLDSMKDLTNYDLALVTTDRRTISSTWLPVDSTAPALQEVPENDVPARLVTDADEYFALQGPLTDITDTVIANVLITRSSASFRAVLNAIRFDVGAVALGVLAIAVVLGFLLSHALTQPLHKLAEAAKRIGEGDYSARIDFRSRDEVGQLATAFNEMGDKLSAAITARAKTQDEIRHTSERLQLIMNSAAEAIYGIDLNGNCTFANQACVKMLGYEDEANLLGQNMHNLIHHTKVVGSHCPVEDCKIFRAFQSGVGTHIDDEFLWRKNGESFAAEYWSYPMVFDGETIGAVVTFIDITERKQAEAELRRREEFLQTLLDTSPVPIYVSTMASGEILMVNEAVGELHKLSRSDLLKHTTKEMYLDLEIRSQLIAQLDETGTIENFDIQARRIGTGELCWLSLSAAPIEYQGEDAAITVAQDITERKESEIRYERLRRGLEATGIGTWVADLKAKTTEWDDCSLDIYGLTREQFLADPKAWENALHPDDRDKTLKRRSDLIAEGATAYVVEYRIVRPSGEVRHVRVEGGFERDEKGKLLYLAGTHRDITERKEAEERLKRQNSLVDLLRQTASVANEAVDFKQGASVCLKSINAYTGWPVGHVYLLSDEDDDLLLPSRIWHVEDKKRFSAIIEATEKTTFRRGIGLPGRVLETGEPAWIRDVTVDPNFPRAKKVDDIGIKGAFAFPVLEGAKVVAVLEFFDEESSEPDESLLRSVTHIGSQLGRLYEREKAATGLSEARDVAEDATRAKDMFLATMSHELRTPLNSVAGLAELLEETELKVEQIEMVEAISGSTRALQHIVDDILDFSKIEAGKLDLDLREDSIRSTVESVGESLGSSARKNDLRLNTKIDPNVPATLLVDSLRIRQILFNLAGNAIKFTHSKAGKRGVVEIGIVLDKPIENGQATVRYYVKDNGIGIPKSRQKDLFKPFHQLDAATTRQYGGTGLGLVICSSLTELMGGKISLDSARGKGSTFSLTLTHPIASAANGGIDEQDLSGSSALVITSSKASGAIIKDYLSASGCNVRSAHGRRAVATALGGKKSKTTFDFIVLDQSVSDEAALELLPEDGRDEILAKTVPLFITDLLPTAVIAPDGIAIRGNPVRRADLLRAAAEATGRVSPRTSKVRRGRGDAPAAKPLQSREAALAAGQLVLVADDNAANRDVINRQLTRLGYTADILNDGVEALKAIERTEYALLLTDCHMPKMDGYDLAENIRKSEAGSDKRLPIVAITADATKTALERCRTAGMDDYLVKPVELQRMAETMSKWLPGHSGDATDDRKADSADARKSREPEAESLSPTGGPVDLQHLERVLGVQDPEDVEATLASFWDSAKDVGSDLSAALAQKDAVAMKSVAHSTKGASRYVGALALGDALEALEAASKVEDWAKCETLLEQVNNELKRVGNYIQSV